MINKNKNIKSKKEILMNSSLDAFIELGFHNTKIDDIVKRAKVGKGTFYLYFKSKDDVVDFLMDEFIEQFNEIHKWIINEINQKNDLKSVYTKEGEVITEIFKKHRLTASFMMKQGRTVNSKIDQRLNDFILLQVKQASLSYQKAIEFGLMDKSIDPEFAAHCVVGGITHIYTQWLDNEINEPVNVILEKTLNFYFKALFN